jgi:hypothetical protein
MSGNPRVASAIAASILWGRHRWLLEAGAGASVLGGSAQWVSLGATHWISSGLGATVDAGGDPRINREGARIRAGVLLRPFSRDKRRPGLMVASLAGPSRPPNGARIEEGVDGSHTLVVPEPSASLIEVRGDATAWQAQPMARGTNGEWRIALRLAPGLTHVQVRIDGTQWVAPTGLPVASDDYRGRVGVIVQP